MRNYLESKNEDFQVYNLGVSGEATEDLIERVESETKAREPNAIIFAIGINDAQFIHSQNSNRISEGNFKTNLTTLFKNAQKLVKTVMFIGLTPVDESRTTPIPWHTDVSYFKKNIRAFDSIIEEFCKEKNLTYISMEGVLENEDLVDGLHPNAEGHRKMFEKIKPEIENSIG